MKNSGILYEYELMLLKKKLSFSPYFFSFTPDNNERMALHVFQYAIEHFLCWSPEEASIYLTSDKIQLMKLDTLLRYIRFPAELNPTKDTFYIVHLIYPHKIKFNEKELVLRVYQQVLSGELYKFPKEYFSDSLGIMRACTCLQYMISKYLGFTNVKDIYSYFSTPAGTKTLKQYRLYAICTDAFVYPIDFVHEALPPQQQNEFWYNYYRFQITNREQINQWKKEKKFKI